MNPCDCRQGRDPCICKGAAPRYNIVQLRYATGDLAKAQFVDAKALDEAEAKLAALREEVARKDRVIEDMVESNSDMTTCLAAAEQRIALMSGFLTRMLKGNGADALAAWQSEMEMVLSDAALNPNPEAEGHE